MSEDGTSSITKIISGDELYQKRARLALPILVRQALAGKEIYYADLAQELEMPNPRNLNCVLGCVGDALLELGELSQKKIPSIQGLVVNQQTGLPGKNVHFLRQIAEPRQKEEIVKAELSKVFSYPKSKWLNILEKFGLSPAEPLNPQLEISTDHLDRTRESDEHKRLKNYVAQHPRSVKLGKSLAPGEIEYRLPSGDEVDVLFQNARCCIAVEVKSHISKEADLKRGLFQCVKYGAILRACRSLKGETYEVNALLAIEGQLPKKLIPVRNTLDVERGVRKGLEGEVNALDGNQLLDKPIDDLCKFFVDKYRIDIPVLNRNEIEKDYENTQIDVSRDPWYTTDDQDGPVYVNGLRIEITVPFTGNASAFWYQPTAGTLNQPRAHINYKKRHLILVITGTNLEEDVVLYEINRTLDKIDNYLTNLCKDAAELNSELDSIARQCIEVRRSELEKNRKLFVSLPFKLKQRDDSLRTHEVPQVAVLGFKRGSPQVSVDELVLDDEQVSNFVTLDYLGAYVVSSSNKQRIEEAQKSFDKSDYEIIPNVQLSLLKPMSPKGIFRRRKKVLWPVESGIRQAHKNGIIGKGVLVGVIDTGCDADHIQFRQKPIDFCYVPLSSGSNLLRKVRGFDVHGHGTHVCGIIAGQHIGIAPGADLMVASVIESETYRTSLSRIGIALNWMLSEFESEENQDKPIVVNMSLGFRPEVLCASERKALMIGIRGFISTLVEDFDVLPIVAIGNDGPCSMHAPGYFPETVSVGAIDFHHQPAPFSGGGISPIGGEMQPDIAGYGVDIFSSLERDTNNRSLYTYMSGTSMATPYVAGIAALYASADAKLQGKALRQHLLNTALPFQAPTDRVGAGLARFTENGNKNP